MSGMSDITMSTDIINYTENIIDLTFHRLAPFSAFLGAHT